MVCPPPKSLTRQSLFGSGSPFQTAGLPGCGLGCPASAVAAAGFGFGFFFPQPQPIYDAATSKVISPHALQISFPVAGDPPI